MEDNKIKIIEAYCKRVIQSKEEKGLKKTPYQEGVVDILKEVLKIIEEN